jgi:hypothetical protein
MIPATKREGLNVLAELCDLSPDVRLGQLLCVRVATTAHSLDSLISVDRDLIAIVLDGEKVAPSAKRTRNTSPNAGGQPTACLTVPDSL